MKTGGLSLKLVNFSVNIIALLNDESVDIRSNFSICDTSRNGITTFNGHTDCKIHITLNSMKNFNLNRYMPINSTYLTVKAHEILRQIHLSPNMFFIVRSK